MKPKFALCFLILVALAAAACGAPPASAHAFLRGADPASEAVLPAPPQQITLRFSEPLVAEKSFIRLLDERGNLISDNDVMLGVDPKIAAVDIPSLAPGVYIVQWSAISDLDGHEENGSYWFRVAAGPGEIGRGGASEAANAAQRISGAEAAIKGLGFLSALLLFGYHAVSLLTKVEATRRARLLLAAAALMQTAYWALIWTGQQRPLLPGLGIGPRFLLAGQIMTIVHAVTFAGYLFGGGTQTSRRGARPRAMWLGFAAGMAALTAYVLTGHTLGASSTPVSAFVFDWIHMAAAGIWVGAIAHLILGFANKATPTTRDVALRLTGLVVAGALALAATGAFNGESRGVAVSTLTHSIYGLALAWKLAFVGLMALLGAFHAFVVNPWRQKGASPRLWRAAVVGESLALVFVLAATAVLTLSPPPTSIGRAETGREAGLTLASHAGPTLIETTIVPNRPGENEVTIRLTDDDPSSPTQKVQIRALPTGATAELVPVRGEPDTYRGTITLSFDSEAFNGPATAFALEVALIDQGGEARSAAYPRWPVPAPGGLELVRSADEAMSRLSTVRVYETLSDGLNTVDRIWWYKAPDQVRAKVVDGKGEMIIIGTDRWTTADGVAWERDALSEPLTVPGFAYADQATEVEILGRASMDGAEAFVVAFRYQDGSYRFVAWIDTSTYRLVRLEMDGPHHFMTWTFDGFDQEVRIDPP